MTWHPSQTSQQSHDRHGATCNSPSPKQTSSVWEQKRRSPSYNLEAYVLYGWALPSPPCTANISVIIPRTKHPPKCSPLLQWPESINNCFYLQWGGKKKKNQSKTESMGTRLCVCFEVTTRICGISHITPATLGTFTKARNAPFSKRQFLCCRNWVSNRPQKYLSMQQAPRGLQAAGLQQRTGIKDRTRQDRNQTMAIEERQLIATKHVKHGSRSRSSTGPSTPYPPPVARNQDLDTNQRCTWQTALAGRHENLSRHVKTNDKELQNLFYSITWLLTSQGQHSTPCCSSLI